MEACLSSDSQARWLPPLIVAAVVLVVGIASLILERSESQRLAYKQRIEVSNQINILRARLEGNIQAQLMLARGLVSFVSTHPALNDVQFQELAKVLVAQISGVRMIELARNNALSHIHSQQGNEKTLGQDLLARKGERETILRAISARRGVFSGPVELDDGSTAFIVRLPVYLTEPGHVSEGGKYWGLVQIVIDAQDFLDEAGVNSNSLTGLIFALRGQGGKGASGNMIAGENGIFSANPVLADVTLPEGSWQIAAVPKSGWSVPGTGWILASGLLLALVSGLFAWFLLRMSARHSALMKLATVAAQRSEMRLSKLKREIEMRIEMRSRALIQTNQELLNEISDRRQAIQKLHEQHTFSLALLRAQSDVDEGVLVIQDKRIVFANEALARLSGYPLDELLNNFPFINLVHPDQREAIMAKHMRRLAGEQFENHYETSLISKNGERHEVELSVAVVHDGKKIQIVVVVRDITERKLLQENLQHMAHFDELTSLPNRALFFDRLKRALADARRHGSGFALLFVDLDGFKKVNDAYGHQLGDQLLNEVARRMEQCVRESDTVARMGGDEFAIILGDINDADDARLVAQKIINSLSTSLTLDGKDCHIGASIGISLYPQDGESSESMLTNADSAMYSAKSKGKNTYCFVRG